MTQYLGESENFLGLPDADANPDRAEVVVVSAPFEQTSSYGMGSSNGPTAILEASHQVEFYDARLSIETFRAHQGIATAAPLDVAGKDGAEVSALLRDAVTEQLLRGKWVLTLGAEHTSIVGAVEAHARRHPGMTVLQLDAHSDLRASYEESPWSHACAMARVLDFHDSLVQVGIRSQAEEERVTSDARALPVFYAEDIHDQEAAGEDWIDRIIANLSGEVYVTLDCDVLDPSIMPSAGTPEPCGLTWRQLDKLFARLCKERKLIGMDVCELAPIEGLSHPQFSAAKLIYRILGYLARYSQV